MEHIESKETESAYKKPYPEKGTGLNSDPKHPVSSPGS